MFYQEDMTIDKKYLNIVNIPIYDTNRKLHGIISEISLLRLSNGLYVQYYAHYNSVNNRDIVFKPDLDEGTIKFVLFNDKEFQKGLLKEAQDREVEAIKEFLGENFTDDSIIWISDKERKKQLAEQEYREKKKIGNFAKWAESPTREFISESYSAMKIFDLYVDRVITEEQFLIELINILAEEKRVQRDMRLSDGLKDFKADMGKVFEENKDFFREVIQNNVGDQPE